MFTIKSVRSTTTFVGSGNFAYDAEARIFFRENNESKEKEAFIHVCWALNETFYTFSYGSDYDYMTGTSDEVPDCEHIEEFTSLEEAQDSEFIDLYRMLDKLLFDMFHGPRKGISDQAVLGTQENVCEADDETYYFAIIQNLKYADVPYQAVFSIETDNQVSIILKKDGVQVEKYEDIELASNSEWFMLFCKLKKALIALVKEYEKKNKKLGGTYAYIMSELLNDR